MIRERLDARIEQRLESIIEPHIEHWLHRFFRSEQGEALIADVTADFLASWLRPGEGKGGGYLERTLIDLVRQLAEADPEFRQAVIAALNPHWHHSSTS